MRPRSSFQNDSNQMPLWYTLEKDVYESVFSMVNFLTINQGWQDGLNLRALRLYGDYKNLGLSANNYLSQAQDTGNFRSRLTYNVVKSVCDSYQAQIAKQNTKVTFLTEGGDWSKQRKAKILTRFVEGLMYQTKANAKMKGQALRSAVFGTAALKTYKEGKSIKAESVFINELKIDQAEAIYGAPRNLYQVRVVSRDVVKADFPEYAEMIDRAEDITMQEGGFNHQADMITVIEAWHLPSKKGAGDGRRALCISSGDLVYEPFEKMHFPFVFTKTGERLLGFFGQGFAEQLTGLQYEINSLLQTIQLAMRLCSIPKVFVEIGSRVVPSQLNNEIGGIIFYSGTPPQYQAIQAVSPELFRQVDVLIARAYELVGLSQLTSQSKKPSGLDSGVALREFKDIENERFSIMQQAFEENYLELAGHFLELAKEIYKEYGEFEVTVEDNKQLQKIKWSEINLDEEAYRMKLYPTSALPSTPAAKLEKVIELYQAGFLAKEEAFSLLQFPDLEAATKRIGADYEDIQMIIEEMLDKGKYMPPEPYQNLGLGIKEVQRAYLHAKTNEAPKDRLELLRKWISQADALLAKAQPQPALPAAAGQPMAPPEQMAPSEMVPYQ